MGVLAKLDPGNLNLTARCSLDSLMTSFAKDRAREGESAEDAMGRLMGEGDPQIRELYDIYSEA